MALIDRDDDKLKVTPILHRKGENNFADMMVK